MPRRPNPNADPRAVLTGRLGLFTRFYGEDDPRTQAARIELQVNNAEEILLEVAASLTPEQRLRLVQAVAA